MRESGGGRSMEAQARHKDGGPMADSHDVEDPNVAPMHHEIQENFSTGQVTLAVLMAIIAIVGGLVAGLTIVNN